MGHLGMPIVNQPKASQIKADETFRRRISDFIEAHGEQETNRLLETPRNTLARVVAGLPVRRATLAFVSTQLDKVAPVDAAALAPKGTDHAPA